MIRYETMTNNKSTGLPSHVQALYYVVIFIAGGMMIWEKSKPEVKQRLWFLLLWFAIMLYAFYKATQNWAYANPKPSKEELLEEARKNVSSMPEIKDVDIPSLEEMSENWNNKAIKNEQNK